MKIKDTSKQAVKIKDISNKARRIGPEEIIQIFRGDLVYKSVLNNFINKSKQMSIDRDNKIKDFVSTSVVVMNKDNFIRFANLLDLANLPILGLEENLSGEYLKPEGSNEDVFMISHLKKLAKEILQDV